MLFIHKINISLHRWLVPILLVCIVGIQEGHAQSAGAFSRLGFGARGMAMSNALIADNTGYTSPYYNPALAPFTSRQNLQASVAFMTFDRQLEFLQFATPLPPVAGVAAGLIHASVSDIDGRSSSGFHTENFSTDEYAAFLAFGLKLGQRGSLGLGLQLFRSDLFNDLQAVNSVGIDLGFTINVSPAMTIGVVADDLLAKYSWDTSSLYSSGGKRTTDKFPVRLRLGASYKLMEGRAIVMAEYESRTSALEYRTREIQDINQEPIEITNTDELTIQQSLFRIGGEYHLSAPFAIRAGLDQIGNSVEGMRPSAGFVLAQPLGQILVWVEYAFALEPYNTGTMHVMTLRLFL